MSSAAVDGSPSATQKTEKKHKKDKSERKKRQREEDDVAPVEGSPRKSKKSKKDKEADAAATSSQPVTQELAVRKKKRDASPAPAVVEETPKKKSSKKSKSKTVEPAVVEEEEAAEPSTDRKKSKKHKKKQEQEDEAAAQSDDAAEEDKKKKKRKSKDKSEKKSRERKRTATPEPEPTVAQDADAMEIDDQAVFPINNPEFPFYTQTTSLYVPFFPIGFDKPLTNVAAQHLDPLLNHYSPTLRGVLLSYSNLCLSDRPVKASTVNPPTDETEAFLHARDEYGVGFGFLTFDAHLFVPSRGKWMEGVLQLQSEGHIGVVCWNKFNASIEAKRLPKGWKWVDLGGEEGAAQNGADSWEDNEGHQHQEEEGALTGADQNQPHVVEQMHSTGYWVDENGRKVSGKLRFRIKNFDVGLAGDYGYLAIEGTFLDPEAERALAAEEREVEKKRRSRQNPNGVLRPRTRKMHDFSMTRLGKEEEEEDSVKKTVLYKGSRPGTPDD